MGCEKTSTTICASEVDNFVENAIDKKLASSIHLFQDIAVSRVHAWVSHGSSR